nr:uncharacterized protein LOC133617317 [Nerophis lumbriciformis]
MSGAQFGDPKELRPVALGEAPFGIRLYDSRPDGRPPVSEKMLHQTMKGLDFSACQIGSDRRCATRTGHGEPVGPDHSLEFRRHKSRFHCRSRTQWACPGVSRVVGSTCVVPCGSWGASRTCGGGAPIRPRDYAGPQFRPASGWARPRGRNPIGALGARPPGPACGPLEEAVPVEFYLMVPLGTEAGGRDETEALVKEGALRGGWPLRGEIWPPGSCQSGGPGDGWVEGD